MIRRKTKERPFGATDERENVILSGTKWSRRISICMLFTAFLSACTDYAAKMEDDFEWKTTLHSPKIADSAEIIDPSSVTTGEMIDSRDKQTYRTVTIGTQTWMAQNLNFETSDSYCYKDSLANCFTYGRLYTWTAAIKACPNGWHLPSKDEFETLFTAVGGSDIAGKMLKSTSSWRVKNGKDPYAFSALAAGDGDYGGNYGNKGDYTGFWISSEGTDENVWTMTIDLSSYDDGAALNYDATTLIGSFKDYRFSVRCLKDYEPAEETLSSSGATPSSSSVTVQSSSSETSVSSSSEKAESSSSKVPEPAEGSMTDARDGQTYRTVVVGSQIWMAQNLNYEAENSLCYDDDPANCATYGRLYTWAAAMTACPSGWHLPSTEEFETLFSAVGGSGTACKMLKSTSGWYNDCNGTDAYAFSALPAGRRNSYGGYSGEGDDAYFWSSTEYDSNYAYGMSLVYRNDGAYLYDYGKSSGFPVRCVKD